MLVSVITPTYNSERFIHDAYGSLVAQSLSDWNWVVTDDGSSDDTPRILRQLAEQDSRLKLEILPRNVGPAMARNRSIERAKGQYLAFLDIDDRWAPQKLERQIDFMRANDYPFSHTWFEEIDAEGNSTGKAIRAPERMTYSDMLKSNRVGCLTAIYDLGHFGKVYMPLIKKRQDYGLWLALLKKTPYVHCLPEYLAFYRTGPPSLSSNKVELLKYNWQLFRDIERLSIPRSAYYLGWNIFRRVLK